MNTANRLRRINNLFASLPIRFISKRATRDYNSAMEGLNDLVREFEKKEQTVKKSSFSRMGTL